MKLLFVSLFLLIAATSCFGKLMGGHDTVTVYTTAVKTDLRLTNTDRQIFTAAKPPVEKEIYIFVNPQKHFQSLLGIGGALTDAAAETFAKLPSAKQNELLTAYYDRAKGIGYTLGRTTIHSSDFSSGSYTYIAEGDTALATFSVAHDQQYRIPLIKRAIAAAGGKLTLFASPWSPPAFMKSNKDMLHGGKLLPEYYSVWARYFVKFIRTYEAQGIPIWGVTVQNEPAAIQTWESCIYSAAEERDFVKFHLGPLFEKEGLREKNIVVWDHNRDLINERVNTIYNDPEASKYVWGAGFHWYETWTGFDPLFSNLREIYESYPEKHLMLTEGCAESFTTEHYQSWPNAERYGNSILNDLNSGACGWTDWNILLDQTGGPNHVGNFCMAPVHADVTTGELIYTPAYYYIGHFSKFFMPGAKRVSSVSSHGSLQVTTFQNPDGQYASVVMNKTEKEIDYNLMIEEKAVSLHIPAHAIQTVLY